jgi:hypothetical protein
MESADGKRLPVVMAALVATVLGARRPAPVLFARPWLPGAARVTSAVLAHVVSVGLSTGG